jgi:transposase
LLHEKAVHSSSAVAPSDSLAALKARLDLGERDKTQLIASVERLASERDTAILERDTAILERDTAILERDTAILEKEKLRELYQKTLELCRKLEKGLIGQKRERVTDDEAQLRLLMLGLVQEQAAAAEASDETDTSKKDEGKSDSAPSDKRGKPTGRKLLPEHLPRVDIEELPEEVKRLGLDAFVRISETVSEVIERRPASLVVVRVHRPKFVLKGRDRADAAVVEQAAPLELPIERGLAGPGLLADTIVRRWQDHLPAHRLEGIYARDGLELARATICGWHMELAELAAPLVDAMWKDALGSPVLCTDATGVLVQDKEKCRRGHFWVVIAPNRHVLFRYSAKHNGQAVDRLVAGYKGYLVADAHAVYDHIFADGQIVEVSCWAHARRYFYKALLTDPERAKSALAMIQALFKIEGDLAKASPSARASARVLRSKPIVERFFAWCDAEVDNVLDESPIAAAIGYARNQRLGLQRFVSDGRLPLHNNHSELALRREAIGRKNWLFVGSDDGGQTNATFVTLLASCQLHGLEPWAYLRDLLCLLPSWPKSRVLELSPLHWKQTAQQPDTQQRLAANPFRTVTSA